jgi:hypothetical protein
VSLHDCLQSAIDSGDLPPARARRAQALFADRLRAHAHLGAGAEALAAEDVWVALRHENILARRHTAGQAKAQMAVADALARHRDSDGSENAASALRQIVEWGQSGKHVSIESRRQALELSYLRDIGDFVGQHRRNILGRVRNKARLPDIVRELKGEATGQPQAKAMAEGIRRAIERARQEANAAGAEIGKLEGYDLPHHWDRKRVAAVTPEAFAARMDPEMDWSRIIDHATGRAFDQSTAAARQRFLMDIHAAIRTGGWSSREPSAAAFGRSLGRSRSDHRVLHFKTADGWLRANDEFGAADPFTAVVEHLKSMARDTAIMQVLGPNPYATLEYARQAALKLAHDRPWTPTKHLAVYGKGVSTYESPEAEVNATADHARRMLDMVRGADSSTEGNVFAQFLAGTVRPFLVASQLGGAMMSAVSDVGYMSLASRHVGIRQSDLFARQLKLLASPGARALVARAGIIAESAASTGVVVSRLFGAEHVNGGFWGRVSEFTLRASLLTQWTDINRATFQLEFYGLLADNAARGWDDIDEPLRRLVFEARGITRADWDVIRATPLYRDRAEPDATFLIPDDIRARTDLDPAQALDLSLRLGAAIREQLEFAVPSANLRGRTSIVQGKAGTIGGEFLKSVAMYKNFTLSLMYNQIGRVLFHQVRGNRASAIAGLALAGLAAGAVTIQLKELARGNDPRPMTDGKFWYAALLQGGGLGIFGDFLYASENRFGGGFAATAAGPVLGLASRVGDVTGTVMAILHDPSAENVDAMQRELIRFANQFSGPTNLWYANAALDRMVWDNLQLWVDPKAQDQWNRAASRRFKEFGNQPYWPHGRALPTRAPDLMNALGGAP